MVHRWIVVALVLFAGQSLAQGRSARPEASACNGVNESCRDDCTMDYGASIRTRKKLGQCLEKCRTAHSDCTERWYELNRANLDPSTFDPPREARRPDPEPVRETAPASEPDAYSDPAPSAASEDMDSLPESTRTRYGEPEAAAAPEAKPEPPPSRVVETDYNEGITIPSDEMLSGPGGGDEEDASAPADRKKQAREETKPRVEPQKESKPGRHPELPPEPKDDISDWDPNAED